MKEKTPHIQIMFGLFLFAMLAIHKNTLLADQYTPLKDPGWVGFDLKGLTCSGLVGGFGPWDYTNPGHRKEKLPVVTQFHFSKEVESLSKGTTGPIAMDIDYTLRAFPNHHRALYAMMRYQLKTPHPVNAQYAPIECYFQRAMAFKPDDYRVMQLYANYLVKKDQPKMAIDIYKRALNINNAPVDINYALGILYCDLKELDKAVEQAKIVYGAGFKKTKLARKLKEANRWPIK